MKNLTIIGGSGFVGKSIIDSFKNGTIKKFNIKKISIICRQPYKIKKIKSLDLNKIKLIKGDISTIKKLPKSDIIIYAAESSNTQNYKNNKNFIGKHKKAVQNFCNIIKKLDGFFGYYFFIIVNIFNTSVYSVFGADGYFIVGQIWWYIFLRPY